MANQRHYLQWHIIHRCNLRCVHCYQDNYEACMPYPAMEAALDKYLRFLADKPLSGQVNLTGGEPLLHPDFLRLAEAVRRSGLRLGVLTNGTLLTDEMAADLADLRPTIVQVSLDGTRRTHDAIRGEGSFDKALRGIDLLKKHGVYTIVSFTAQQGYRRQLPALSRVCSRHGVDKLWWDRVVTDSPERAAKLALSTAQFTTLALTGNLLRRVDRCFGGCTVDNGRALQCLGSMDRPLRGYRCNAGQNLLVLLADGRLMACRRLPFIIGHIDDGELDDILAASPTITALRTHAIPDACRRCRFLSVCNGGARCVTYGQTGHLDIPDVNCPFHRSAYK